MFLKPYWLFVYGAFIMNIFEKNNPYWYAQFFCIFSVDYYSKILINVGK